MLNRRNCTRNGHDWNPKPDMELERSSGEGGGSHFVEGGFAKRGVRTNPPGYGPAAYIRTYTICFLRACQRI